MAGGVHDSGRAGISVASGLAMDVPAAGGASADWRGGAADDSGGDAGIGERAENEGQRIAEAAADVGNDYFQDVYGPGVVFCYGLVPDLSGGQRDFAEERVNCGVDSVSGGGFGEFFWRGGFGISDTAGGEVGSGAEGGGGVWG